MADKFIISNARIISPGVDKYGSVLIEGDKIAKIFFILTPRPYLFSVASYHRVRLENSCYRNDSTTYILFELPSHKTIISLLSSCDSYQYKHSE